MRQVPIVIPGEWPILYVPAKFSNAQFNSMLRMLESIREGLVTDHAASTPDSAGDGS